MSEIRYSVNFTLKLTNFESYVEVLKVTIDLWTGIGTGIGAVKDPTKKML